MVMVWVEVRSLLTQVTFYPVMVHKQPMRLELVGNLGALLAEPNGNYGGIELVAGGRYARRRYEGSVPYRLAG